MVKRFIATGLIAVCMQAGFSLDLPDLNQRLSAIEKGKSKSRLVFEATKSQQLFPGIDYVRLDVSAPRMMKAFLVRVDLTTPGLRLTGTGRSPDYWMEVMPDFTNRPYRVHTKRQRTREFLREQRRPVEDSGKGRDMVLAVNSLPWEPWVAPTTNQWASSVFGPLVCDGLNVTPEYHGKGALFVVWKDGTASIADHVAPAVTNKVHLLHPGFQIILKDGKSMVKKNKKNRSLAPRTAFGTSHQGKALYFLIVDGRQPKRSLGADMSDLVALLKKAGATDAVNMDGGGSSTLVYWDREKETDVLCNRHGATEETRPVAASVGVYFEALDRN